MATGPVREPAVKEKEKEFPIEGVREEKTPPPPLGEREREKAERRAWICCPLRVGRRVHDTCEATFTTDSEQWRVPPSGTAHTVTVREAENGTHDMVEIPVAGREEVEREKEYELRMEEDREERETPDPPVRVSGTLDAGA